MMHKLPQFPKGVQVSEFEVTFSQENDTCEPEADGQFLQVRFQNNGTAFFPTISCARWAFDDVKLFRWALDMSDHLSEIWNRRQ